MKKIAAALLAASMLVSLAACDTGKTTSSEPVSTGAATSDTASAAESAEETGLTKEKYDAMTADDLLADIADKENVTADEYTALIETYRFADIVDDPDTVNYMGLADNITDEAINSIEYSARPETDSYISALLKSEYPQVRGYGLSQMGSLFGVSDDNVALAKELLKTEEDDYVLYKAISALSNELKDDPEIAEFAFRMSEDENPKLRYQAAIAIGNSWSVGVDGVVDKIIEMMSDENEEVRGIACDRSGNLGDEKVIDPLVKILNDENESGRLKAHCVSGLCTLWYDYPFHKKTSEKAYNATMDYFKKTPRSDEQPYWLTISELTTKADSSYDEWKAAAPYFDPDELCAVMTDIIKDENANWLGRSSAIRVIKVHGTEQQFKDLKAVVDGLTDDKASLIQSSYEDEAKPEE